jgi:hypothetical protein
MVCGSEVVCDVLPWFIGEHGFGFPVGSGTYETFYCLGLGQGSCLGHVREMGVGRIGESEVSAAFTAFITSHWGTDDSRSLGPSFQKRKS